MSCVKTEEPIEMLFLGCGFMWAVWNVLGGGSHWRHVLNTIAPSMCSCDAGFCHISYFDHLIFAKDYFEMMKVLLV